MHKDYLLLLIVLIGACQTGPAYYKISGKTMGTTYNIQYSLNTQNNIQSSVDSLLKVVNESVSTYIPTSLISKYNTNDFEGSLPIDDHFERIYTESRRVTGSTSGAFDPTVMPLVNYWGFGYEPREFTGIDSSAIDSIKQHIGFHLTNLQGQLTRGKLGYALLKQIPDVQLDFSAIAKGYGVDAVANLLEKKGVENYLVEIGGEVKAKGVNSKGQTWTIGINKPSEDERIAGQFNAIVRLSDLAMATSGNYRNFKVIEGKKVVHTINPKTGFPEVSNLLSATVFANNCMTADAFATAFMVMGLDKAHALASRTKALEAYFIYSDENGELQEKYTAYVDSLLVR